MPSAIEGGDVHVLHASAVAVGNRGLLICGASGSGKSSLALQMIALGASLVADDRVLVRRRSEGGLHLSCPEPIRGMIEARGFGLLAVPRTTAIAVALVDLDAKESERLPVPRETLIAGEALPSFRRVEAPHFASILLLYLKGGCVEG